MSKEVLACEDLFGNPAFKVVQSDLTGNIEVPLLLIRDRVGRVAYPVFGSGGEEQKIRTRQQATPDKSDTLEKMVVHEQGEKKKTATQGLLWLTRFHFFSLLLFRVATDD